MTKRRTRWMNSEEHLILHYNDSGFVLLDTYEACAHEIYMMNDEILVNKNQRLMADYFNCMVCQVMTPVRADR